MSIEVRVEKKGWWRTVPLIAPRPFANVSSWRRTSGSTQQCSRWPRFSQVMSPELRSSLTWCETVESESPKRSAISERLSDTWSSLQPSLSQSRTSSKMARRVGSLRALNTFAMSAM